MEGDSAVATFVVVMFAVFVFVIWVAWGAFCARLMRNKGRSEAVGWCLGLGLGLFGFVIVLLVPEDEERKVTRLARAMQAAQIPPAQPPTAPLT